MEVWVKEWSDVFFEFYLGRHLSKEWRHLSELLGNLDILLYLTHACINAGLK